MPTTTAPKRTAAVAAWADRRHLAGLGLTEALAGLHADWSTGPAASHDDHARRLAAMSELADALRAATVHASLEAVDAGIAPKDVAANLGSTGATITKWVKEARAAG